MTGTFGGYLSALRGSVARTPEASSERIGKLLVEMQGPAEAVRLAKKCLIVAVITGASAGLVYTVVSGVLRAIAKESIPTRRTKLPASFSSYRSNPEVSVEKQKLIKKISALIAFMGAFGIGKAAYQHFPRGV